ERYQHAELDDIREKLAASHQEAMEVIESIPDADLFTPKVYKWTKSTTLGSYFTSSTASHYDWAIKNIRRGLKAKQRAEKGEG
ncbi:MAG: ClbS/DfsB family four-helix bundle protein, partial [Chloroflexota bacterium]